VRLGDNLLSDDVGAFNFRPIGSSHLYSSTSSLPPLRAAPYLHPPVMAAYLNHDDYTIAWIAVLPIEAEAALGMLDKQHQGHFASVRGDDYIYIGGEINGHNVVVATWPAGQKYGVGAAAALVNQVKTRFQNIWFALLVGVAAGLPNLTPSDRSQYRDVRLGDVLVCVPEKASSGIIHYDLGKDTDAGFLTNEWQAETPAIVRAAIGNIQLTKKKPYKEGHEFARLLAAFLQVDEDGKFRCPSQDTDQLFTTSADLVVPPTLILREPRDETEKTRVWYGNIGSGNSLMRNARRRDELRDRHNLIGLEMEAAGIMNTLPTGVIRGVCDYGDDQKNKDWQPYAAAVAAVYAKGILLTINPKVVQTQQGQSWLICAKLDQISSYLPVENVRGKLHCRAENRLWRLIVIVPALAVAIKRICEIVALSLC
jgi:nucleoside phosphorylase